MKDLIHQINLSYGKVLDQLEDYICLIDQKGEVFFVNQAWKNFAKESGATHFSPVGSNYFRSYESAGEEGRHFINGLRQILAGKSQLVEVEYPFHSPTQKRWFKGVGRPIHFKDQTGAIIIHCNQTNRVDSAREVELLLSISEIIYEADDFTTALKQVLELLCTTSQWAVGEIWLPKEDSPYLTFSGACFCTDKDLDIFCKAAERTQFRKGSGLPGIVWETNEYHWIDNLQDNDDFLRRKEVKKLGINAALGVPVKSDGELQAILALYHVGSKNKDEHLVKMMLGVCKHLGLLISELELKKSLNRSANLFQSIVQDQSEMIVRWNRDGQRTFVNQAYLDMFQVKEDEVIGSTFYDLILEEDLPAVKSEIEQFTPGNPTRRKPHRVKLPNGKIGWQDWTDRAFFDSDGKPVEFQSVGRDITELVVSRQALEESKERYRNAFNQQFQMTVLLDLEGKVVLISDSALRRQNVPREDYIGQYFWKCPAWEGNKEWQEKIKEQVFAAKEARGTIIEENPFYGEDKQVRYANASYSLVTDNAGKAENILVEAIDITEEKKSKARLIEREKLLNAIYENVSDFIGLFRYKGGHYFLEAINQAFVRNVRRFNPNFRVEDILGGELTENLRLFGLGEKLIEQRKAKYDEAVKIKEELHFLEITDMGEQAVYGDTRLRPILNAEKEVEYVMWTSRDITESYLNRKKMEASEAKLSLIYNSSNDFMLLIRVEKSGYFIESVNDATVDGLINAGIMTNREELEGMNMLSYFTDLLSYDQTEISMHFEKYAELKESRQIVRYTTESVFGGHAFAIDTRLTPILNRDKVKYILTVSRDISDLVLSKVKLQKAYEELEEMKSEIEQENIYLREEIKQTHDFENMVFQSEVFRQVLDQVEDVAETSATVLITGETGTGKELIARAIHDNSRRADKPMIKINAAAIPKDLIESELFGYEKGAFTGAINDKPGKFELANGTTLFLDEIGDMPLDLQVKILRVLQEGEVERLGSNETKKVDVRIIAAANKDLKKAVEKEQFREDLYYRLNVFPICLPALRERSDDIPILTLHFIAKYSRRHNKQIEMIPKAVMNYLIEYQWPGNVRELENTIERAVILSKAKRLSIPGVKELIPSDEEEWTSANSLDEVLEQHIRKTLAKCNWKVEGEHGAAAQLEIKPSTLRDKMKRFKIERPD